MDSITVSIFDQDSIQWIRNESNRLNLSFESVITRILKEVIDQDRKKAKQQCFSDLDALAGTWSDEDFEEFIDNTKLFTKTDDELWK